MVWFENCSHLDEKLAGPAHAAATMVDYLMQGFYQHVPHHTDISDFLALHSNLGMTDYRIEMAGYLALVAVDGVLSAAQKIEDTVMEKFHCTSVIWSVRCKEAYKKNAENAEEHCLHIEWEVQIQNQQEGTPPGLVGEVYLHLVIYVHWHHERIQVSSIAAAPHFVFQ